MKKYIAPEMEIAKFAMEDIITVSGGTQPPVTSEITEAANASYTFEGLTSAAVYDTF